MPEQVPELGFGMAAKRRHWKEKKGRFWARISIPSALRPFFGNKTELIEPLGGDLRIANRNHAAAVARLQTRVDEARGMMTNSAQNVTGDSRSPVIDAVASAAPVRALTDADLESAVWETYTTTLAEDAAKRASMPTPKEIEEEREKVFERLARGEVDVFMRQTSVFNVHTDFELKAGARAHDLSLRSRRLAALRKALTTGETRFVDAAVTQFVRTNLLAVEPGSRQWQDLAEKFMRAQIQALERTIEFDNGVFGGSPTDPLIRPPTKTQYVSLMELFRDYMADAQSVGKHLDGEIGRAHV